MRSPSLPASERRSQAASGLVAGALAGALTGALDALLSGAGTAGVVATYLSAVGLVVGALLGLLGGWLASLRLRPARRSQSDHVAAMERGVGAVAIGVAIALFAVLIVPLATLFGSAFRNRELAALTLAVAVIGLWLGTFFAGGVAAGLAERILMRLAADRRARALRALPYGALAFVTGVVGLVGFNARAHLDLQDLRTASLLLVFVCLALLGRRLLFVRGFRFAALPWALRRAALVALVVCGYATFQLLTGGAPKAIAAARPLVALGSVAIPAPEDTSPASASGAEAPSQSGDSIAHGKATRAGAKSPAVVGAVVSAMASSAEGSEFADGTRTATAKPAGADPASVQPGAAPRAAAPSVLLITLDSVRADHLPIYGYARATMPKLQAYSQDCLVFERAYAASSAERDALAALHTGRLPGQLQRGPGAWPRLTRSNRTLAQVLGEAGYHTAAVVSHDAHGAESGLGRGFATFDSSAARRGERASLSTATSQLVAEKTQALLAAAPREKPLFLWAHFADPHGAYLAHPNIDLGRKRPDRYDGELAFTDEHLGALLNAASKAGRPLWVIIAADHGESLGERGRAGHGASLDEPEVHVPLLICAPGVKPRRVEAPVSVLDLYPTLIEAAGGQVPKGLPGRSLARALAGAADFVRGPVPMEIAPTAGRLGAAALVDGNDKLSLVGAGNHPRLFDLRADPTERRSRALLDPQRVRKLQIALLQLRVPTLGEPRAARTPGRSKRGIIQATEDAAEQEALVRARKRKEAMRGKP